MSPAKLSENIAVYNAMSSELEMDHNGKWVVIYDRAVSGYFDDETGAIQHAVREHGEGPYLIRIIGDVIAPLPASVVYEIAAPGVHI